MMHGSMNIKFMEGDYHRQRWTTWLLWKEATKTVTYSSSVTCSLWRNSIYMQHCVQLGTELQQWHRQLYMSGVTTPLKNDSVKLFESSQADGSHV